MDIIELITNFVPISTIVGSIFIGILSSCLTAYSVKKKLKNTSDKKSMDNLLNKKLQSEEILNQIYNEFDFDSSFLLRQYRKVNSELKNAFNDKVRAPHNKKIYMSLKGLAGSSQDLINLIDEYFDSGIYDDQAAKQIKTKARMFYKELQNFKILCKKELIM